MARKMSAREKRVKRMQSEYKKLAATANRRMTLLEKLSQNPDYKAVLGYAYKDAAYDLKALGVTKNRFPQDIAKLSAKETDIRHLQAMINTAKEFLESPSSLKSGIDKTYKARAKTLNKKYGTDFTADNMKTFFDSAIFEKMKSRLGSAMAMKVIGKIQKNSEDIINDIKEARMSHKKITFDALSDIDGIDVNGMLDRNDKAVIGNLARIYSTYDT